MLNKADWVYMPHPAHFCSADKCRFFLATWVGGYIVSTIGEYVLWPDRKQENGLPVFAEVSPGKLYETMVFAAHPQDPKDIGAMCCPFQISTCRELEVKRYTASVKAARGHLELCEKWSKIPKGYKRPKEDWEE